MKSLWIIKSPSVSSWLQYVSINPSTQRAMMSPRLLCLSNWSRRMRHTSVFFGVNRRSRYPQMGQSTGWVETNRLDRLVFWYQWDYLLINQVKKIRASKIGHDNIYKNIYIYIYYNICKNTSDLLVVGSTLFFDVFVVHIWDGDFE